MTDTKTIKALAEAVLEVYPDKRDYYGDVFYKMSVLDQASAAQKLARITLRLLEALESAEHGHGVGHVMDFNCPTCAVFAGFRAVLAEAQKIVEQD